MRLFGWLRREKFEKIDPMEFVFRAEAIQTRLAQVLTRAKRYERSHDIEGLEAARDEAELLLDNMRELRLEQLAAVTDGYRVKSQNAKTDVADLRAGR